MIPRRKREFLLLEAHHVNWEFEEVPGLLQVPGTIKFLNPETAHGNTIRVYCKYSNAFNMRLAGECGAWNLLSFKECISASGELEWETAVTPWGAECSLMGIPIIDGWNFVHIDECLIEGGPVSYSAECDSYCILFEWIGDRFYDIEEWWGDFGASAESWWVIGDEVKTLCGVVAVPFREAKEFFYELDEWCESICVRIGNILSISEILAKINDTFTILSYTTSQFVTWLYSSLQESINFEGLWDWINNADDWFDTKLTNFKEGLEDWIAEKFEAILDKVFKP